MPENRDDIDLDGWNLHRAAEENRSDIVRTLLARGDDVDARNKT
jgi:ankyrin repeat protein